MIVEVLYWHPSGQHETDRWRAPKITVDTFGDGRAVVKLRDKRGRTREAIFYDQHSRIRNVHRVPP